MQVEVPIGEVILQLPHENASESGIWLEIIKRVDNFLNIKVNVGVVILESDRMCNLVLALALLDEDGDERVEILDDQGNFLLDDLRAQVLLDLGWVVKFIDVVSEMSFKWVADWAVF